MGLTKKEKEILELWKDGEHYRSILAKGYRIKIVNRVLDRYTRKNAKRWLI